MDQKYKILIPLMIAGVMNTVDSSVMNVAMSTFAEFFKVPLQTVSWISSAYLLVLASLLLTSGRIGDIFGFKKPFEVGLFIFTMGTALCGFAPNLATLITARVFQAIGASLNMAAIPALITSYFPQQERGRAMGFYTISVSVGLILGPALGGLILTKFIWRYIFFINIPLGIIALITSSLVIPKETEKKDKNFDYGGTILALVFLISLLFYINQGSSIGWLSNTGLVVILTSIISFIAFIFVEKKTSNPMLDLALFNNKVFVGGLACNFMYFVAQMVMVFLAPILLSAATYPPKVIGFTVIAFPAAMMFFAPIGGNLSDRVNPNFISVLGSALAGLSVLLLCTLSPLSFSYVDVILRMSIFGVGGGLFETSNALIILSNVPEYRRGIASGILAMVRNMGMVFGVAISSLLSSLRSEYYRQTMILATDAIRDIAAIKGVKDVYMLAFMFASACVLIALIGAFYTKKTLSIEKTSMR
ncbi:MAG: DHA2 family efflux MFS transporter permease subunit [Thermoanaerobacteraceae bacterium]|nr:DHA2 family efflux MFS transporter permease subunit [Thermoanaerobacteraceae bacterium]